MIMLKDNAILVIGQDGRSTPFEPEDLQTRIIKSCLSSGNKDVWIAQDISLSVEYALSSKAGGGTATVRAAELDALVTRILDETGYHDVAESFRVSAPKEEGLLDCSDTAMLAGMVSKRLGISGDKLESVTLSLLSALANLGVERCSPELALALARHYKDSLPDGVSKLKAPSLKSAKGKGEGEFLAESPEILKGLPDSIAGFVSDGVISIRPLSRLFPVLALDLRLAPLAERAGFERPVTELALAPGLGPLVAAIDAMAERADVVCSLAGRGDRLPLPLWVRMADISEFCSDWLGYGPEGVGQASRELASMVLSPLAREPFKTTLI